jgi:hypothetical protein
MSLADFAFIRALLRRYHCVKSDNKEFWI